MAKYPQAKQRILEDAAGQPGIVPWMVIVHSAGGSSELEGWWDNPQSHGLESHFFIDDDVNEDGYASVYQYVD